MPGRGQVRRIVAIDALAEAATDAHRSTNYWLMSEHVFEDDGNREGVGSSLNKASCIVVAVGILVFATRDKPP